VEYYLIINLKLKWYANASNYPFCRIEKEKKNRKKKEEEEEGLSTNKTNCLISWWLEIVFKDLLLAVYGMRKERSQQKVEEPWGLKT
jgi:hypothetical protein